MYLVPPEQANNMYVSLNYIHVYTPHMPAAAFLYLVSFFSVKNGVYTYTLQWVPELCIIIYGLLPWTGVMYTFTYILQVDGD